MGEKNERRFTVTEDWLATLLGLAIVCIIAAGLLGPGKYTVTIEAVPGEMVSQEIPVIAGWQVSANLGDERIAIDEAADNLAAGGVVGYLCLNDSIQVAPDAGTMSVTDQALLTVQNDCDQNLTITYKTDKAIPWPLFGLFSQ